MKRHIYAITNTRDGITYVGDTSTAKLARCSDRSQHAGIITRFAEHLGALERNDHFNPKFQADWNSGLQHSDLVFNIIENMPDNTTRIEAERRAVEWMKVFPHIYNLKGITHTNRPIVNEAEIRNIEALLLQGHTGKAVAELTGYSTGTVSLVKTGKIREYRAAKQMRKAIARAARDQKANEVWVADRKAGSERIKMRWAAFWIARDAEYENLFNRLTLDPVRNVQGNKINVCKTLTKHEAAQNLGAYYRRYLTNKELA